MENGLSQNTVRAIVQDRRGFLWFATEEGLNRFDGYSFVVYRHKAGDSSSLHSDIVTALYEDSKGRFWVGARGGLSRYDPRTETFVRRLSTREEVMTILEDRRGRLWIGTDGNGLYRLDDEQAEPVSYQHTDEAGSLANNKVYALLEDRRGQLWVGTHGGGLNLLDADEKKFVHYRHDAKDPASLADDEVWSLAEDPRGRIWVGTNGKGASVLDLGQNAFRHYWPATVVASLYVDRAGTLWLGADAGLGRHVAETDSLVVYSHSPTNPHSLGWNTVRSIYQDVQGNLWVSTFATGLNLLRRDDHPFRLHTRRANAPGSLSPVKAFLEDRQGRIWVGTADGQLNRFDPGKGVFLLRKFDDGAVLSAYQDRKGRIWLGTYGGGLYLYDAARDVFVPHRSPFNDPTTRAEEQVWAIDEDDRGALWLGTAAGVFRYEPDTGRSTRYLPKAGAPASLSHENVRAFHKDQDGNLWIATLGGGLNLLPRDGEAFVHYRHDPNNPKTLSNDLAIALHRDRLGRLWVGTFGGGLNLFDPADGSFVAFRQADGLPSGMVYAILEDDDGRLWLSTNNGLCRFDPKTKRGERYDATNGLQSLQFNLGAALRARSGEMLFGSWNGFYSFDPKRVTPNPNVPPVVLTALEVLNEPRATEVALPLADEIRLHHDDKIITFEFAVLDYTFPRRNNYQYKLEGFDDDWVSVGTKRDVTFTNLDPGSYVFHIKGSNSDGVWDQKGRSLRLVIPPPFWKTWWFQVSSVLAFLGVIFSAHVYRVRRHEIHERELELRVDEAMSKLKVLKGLLPICATCKKVRDDKGYWNQIESYIRSHSEADFSHGICPDCIVKYWGNTRAAAGLKKRES